MKISTKGRYALEIVTDLAVHSDREHPESLTVKDTLRAVEGEMAPVECLTTVKECGIDCSKCPTRETWGVMWEIILQTMEDVTISDLVKRAMENAGSIKTEYGRMS